MKDSYITLTGIGIAEIVERKSRFIAYAAPVMSGAEAEALLAGIRKKHYSAAHNVYAYVLDGGYEKQSDDGEPSGTSGMPVLTAIKSQNIINAIVIVTRYFGGTLLGAGGLVRAYGLAAKEGLAAAGIIKKTLSDMYEFNIAYHLLGKFRNEFEKRGFTVTGTEYTSGVLLRVLAESPRATELLLLAADLSNGTVAHKFISRDYV